MIIKVNLKNIPKQGLSTREASRILKITPTTLYHRLKKLRETGVRIPLGSPNHKPPSGGFFVRKICEIR